jgi:hypothetical protein
MMQRCGEGRTAPALARRHTMHGYLQSVVDHAGHCANREFAELPGLCPVCQRHMQPFRLAARATDASDAAVDFAFQCSLPDCRRVFVSTYRLGVSDEYELERVGADPWHTPVQSLLY